MCWKNISQSNEPKKWASVAILISNKINLKPKIIKRDGEGHIMLTFKKIHYGSISVLNNYDQNSTTNTLVKEMILKLKSHIEGHTLTMG